MIICRRRISSHFEPINVTISIMMAFSIAMQVPVTYAICFVYAEILMYIRHWA
jgi:hypothetical protein